MTELDRRSVLKGAAATAVVGVYPLLTACSSGETGSSDDAASGNGSASSGGGENVLARTSEIPVGGGKVFGDQEVVVTQPTKGEFEAFSAICTHQGCPVSGVSDGTIHCPCHGSMYRITDAKVVGGPAPKPLPRRQITVKDGEIVLG